MTIAPERAHSHGPGNVPVDLAPTVRSVDPADFTVPRSRDEAWRFTPMRRLRGLAEEPTDAPGRIGYHSEAAQVSVVDIGDERLSGFLASERPGAVAWSRAQSAALVQVAAGVDDLQRIRLQVEARGGVTYGHVRVEVPAHTRAEVIIEHVGDSAHIGNVDIRVGDGAELTLTSLQQWDDTAVHLGYQQTRLGRDARFRSVVVTLGGEVVRLLPSVEYTAPGGDAELFGAFYADGGRHLEHRLLADHTEPHCRSYVVYKGALAGAGTHTVWVGDVIIRAAAVGTDTYELNRNLVLTDGARADSVPNLEIETGEIVGAGHASATGRFDDQQLFYLQARGIPEALARRMVVRGFVADVIRRAGDEQLREEVLAAIDERLAAAEEAS